MPARGRRGRITKRPRPTAATDDRPGAAEIARLARQLIKAASNNTPAYLGQTDDGVIVDLEADGLRCVVTAQTREAAPQSTLSPREREIVRMVSQGYPTKTIAAVLDISSWTVSTHLRRIFTKLAVRTRAAMVARAIQDGVIPPLPQPPTVGRFPDNAQPEQAGRPQAAPADLNQRK